MKRLIPAPVLTGPQAVAQQGVPDAHFVQNRNLDDDGRVTVEEPRRRRKDVFLAFDANGEGCLEAEEYTLFDEARANVIGALGGPSRGALKRAADGMTTQRNDIDGDGRVSRETFPGRAGAWPDSIHSDGEVVVTKRDFGRGARQGS